jgi:arylsulfatase A-like enzyme
MAVLDRKLPSPGRAALAATIAAWGAELLLVRASSSPVFGWDMLVSAVLYGSMFAVVSRLGGGRVGGALARLPLLFLFAGIAGAPLYDHGAAIYGLVAAAALSVVGGAVWAHRNGDGPVPGPAEIVLVAAACAAAGWLADGEHPGWNWIILWWVGLVAVAGLAKNIPLAAVSVVVVCGFLPPSTPAPTWRSATVAAQGPDLVLVTVDTLRYDRGVGQDGAALLPSLVALRGASGEAVAAAPWTLPSMATILTGLPLDGHGAVRHADGTFGKIPDSAQTLAERLSAAGYDTAAVVAPNPWLGASFGFAQGFDWFDHRRDATRGALPRGPYPGGRARPIAGRLATALGWVAEPDLGPSGEVIDRALAVAAARRRERPLFLWVHLFDPHLPYSAPVEAPRTTKVALSTLTRRLLVGGRSELDPSWVVAGYDAEVAAVDASLARFFEGLGPDRMRSRVVLVTADHGEELGDHGGWEHGHALWQAVSAVPLVLVGRDWRAEQPAAHVDVAATLLAAAGVARADLPGRDLGQPGASPRTTTANLMHGTDPWGAVAVRRGRWKAIRTQTGDHLYDVVADPGEANDLAATNEARVRELLAGVVLPKVGETVDISGEQGLLEALGYAEPGE